MLTGGAGGDSFEFFMWYSGYGRDVVTDYESGQELDFYRSTFSQSRYSLNTKFVDNDDGTTDLLITQQGKTEAQFSARLTDISRDMDFNIKSYSWLTITGDLVDEPEADTGTFTLEIV